MANFSQHRRAENQKIEEHKAQEIETTGFIAKCSDTKYEEELDIIEEELAKISILI